MNPFFYDNSLNEEETLFHSKVRSSLFMSMCLGILVLISACGSIANTSAQSIGVQSLTVSTHATSTATSTAAPTVPSMQAPLKQQSVYFASENGVVTSLNASTGAMRWQYHSMGKLHSVVVSPMAVFKTPLTLSHGVLYIVSRIGIEAVNVSNGSKLWQVRSGLVQSIPVVSNGIVYADNTERLLALDARNGKVIWSRGGNPPYQVNAVSDGVVYAEMYDKFGAFNASNGQLIWQRTITPERFFAVANGVAYFITDIRADGTTAYDAHNGSLLWKSSKTVFGAASNITYTLGKDFYVYGLNATNGSVIWQSKKPFFWHASPELVDGVIYATTAQDAIVALNPADGSQLWSSSAFNGHIDLNGGGYGLLYAFYMEHNQIKYGNIVALNTHNGALAWKTAIGYTFDVSLAGMTNKAVCLNWQDLTTNSVALFTTNGKVKWHNISSGQIPGAVLG